MTDGLSWFFQLVDRASGPAKDITRSLSSVSDSLKQIDAGSKTSEGNLQKIGTTIRQMFGASAEGAFYKGASGIAGLLDKVDKVIPLDALKAIGGGLLSAGSMVGGFALDLAKTAAGIALAIGGVLAGLTVAGFKMAAEAADAKRTMLLGLQTQLGAATDAGDFLDRIEGFAKKTAFEKDTFTGFAKSLLGAGFGQDELKPLLGALSDIQAGNGTAGAEQLLSQLTKIRSTDKVGTKDLTGLGSIGVSNDKIFEALAEQRSITLKQAKALFESGNLKSGDALTAILGAIQKQSGGVLGSKGLELEKGSLGAQIQHLKDGVGDLFENVNTKPLTDFLGKLNDAISGPIGEKIGATINKAFDAIAKLFNVDGQDLEKTLDKVADGFEAVVDWTIKFAASVKETWAEVEPPLTKLGIKLDVLMGGSVRASPIWTELALSFELFVNSIASSLWVIDELTNLSDTLTQVGFDIVMGIWHGIESGWAEMMTKFHELVDLLPASAKKILGIQSPSKVFGEIGMQTGRGFAIGLDASDIPSQIDAALKPPPSPSIGSITAGAFASRAGGSPINIEINVTVEGGGRDEAFAHEIAEQVRAVALPALMDAMEQLQIESGG